MEVSGQLYTPAVLPLVNEPLVFIEYGDGVDSRANMNVLEKVLGTSTRNRNPDLSLVTTQITLMLIPQAQSL